MNPGAGTAAGAVIAAVDLGTSRVKVALIATSGETLASGMAGYPTLTGPNGEREQDPNDWWAATAAALARALAAGATADAAIAGRIVALAATGQMQDLICTDAARALRSTLLYSDTRAGRQHDRLVDAFPEWESRSGNLQDSSNVAAKLAWLAENEPDVMRDTTTFLFSAAGYLLWRAGGEAACDLVTASVTGLLDVERRDWFHELVVRTGATSAQLPLLVHGRAYGTTRAESGPESRVDSSADSIVGTLSVEAAAELGLPAGIPLVLAMGDAAATTDGLVGTEPGDASVSLGTTGWFAQVVETGEREPEPPSAQHSIVLPGWQRRLRIGAVLSAGASAAWACETFLPGRSFAEADMLAAERLDAEGLDATQHGARPPSRVLCLPGLSGERTPVRDNSARGSFVGVTDHTDAVDLYLAVLTGVAMGLRHAADEMTEASSGARPDRIVVVGGGAVSPVWRRILAGVFDVPIVTRGARIPASAPAPAASAPAVGAAPDDGSAAPDEPGTVSAAALAADALGLTHRILPLFSRPDHAASTEQITAPGPEAAHYQELLPIHRALYDALSPAFHALAGLQSAKR